MEMPPNRIAELMESKDLSWASLAVACDVGEVTIKRWARRETAIPDSQKFRLAKEFGVEVAHLMGWDRQPLETGKAA